MSLPAWSGLLSWQDIVTLAKLLQKQRGQQKRCRSLQQAHAAAPPPHSLRPGAVPALAYTTQPRTLPHAVAPAAVLVACIVLVSLNFDAQKIEGLLVWVQENKRQGSLVFLVREGRGGALGQPPACVSLTACLPLAACSRPSCPCVRQRRRQRQRSLQQQRSLQTPPVGLPAAPRPRLRRTAPAGAVSR